MAVRMRGRCCGTPGSRATARRCTRRGETRGVSAVGLTGLAQPRPSPKLAANFIIDVGNGGHGFHHTSWSALEAACTAQPCMSLAIMSWPCLLRAAHACCARKDLAWGIARAARKPSNMVCASTDRMRTRLSLRWWSISCRRQASRRQIRRGPLHQPCCRRRRRRPQLLSRAGAWAAPTAACSHSTSHRSRPDPSAGCGAS